MLFLYIKALHIIFVVTWFAGLFYIVRLFIYSREAKDRPPVEREILLNQFRIMIKRLWLGITWPSCILTLIFGSWIAILYGSLPVWLIVKICFVTGLMIYHLAIHKIYREHMNGTCSYSSLKLRLWNEVATLFLFAIVFLVVLKNAMSFLWGILLLAALSFVLTAGIRIYKHFREK